MQAPIIRRRRVFDFLFPALLLFLALAVAYPRWLSGIDWRDEGLLAYGTVRVAQGEIPHRDFVSLQPPLSYYTSAIFFKIGGTSLATLRLFGLSIFLLLPLLIYALGRRLTAGPILSFAAATPACVLGLPYCYFVPLGAWQGIAVSLAAVLLLAWALFSSRQWPAFPAGLFTAASLFLRHDQATYTIISILVLVLALSFADTDPALRTKLKWTLLFWTGGIIIVAVPLTIVWWKIGALPEMFRQLILFPFVTYRKTSSLPFPKITAGASILEKAVVALYYLPLIVQGMAALYLGQSIVRRRFRLNEAILAFLFVWSALFYLQVTVRSDQTHLLMTLPPFFLLSAFGWSILTKKIAERRWITAVLSTGAAILAGSFVWILHSILWPDVSRAKDQLALERGGVRIEQAAVVASFIRSLQDYVKPSQSILALPYQPMFYFLCERRNPTRWNYLWPGDQTTRDYERFIEEAERRPPAVILMSERRELRQYAAPIVRYAEEHYDETDHFGQLAIYVRRDTD